MIDFASWMIYGSVPVFLDDSSLYSSRCDFFSISVGFLFIFL